MTIGEYFVKLRSVVRNRIVRQWGIEVIGNLELALHEAKTSRTLAVTRDPDKAKCREIIDLDDHVLATGSCFD